VIGTFLLIGIVFLPIGIVLQQQSESVVEHVFQYDGEGMTEAEREVNCAITEANEGKDCTFTVTVSDDMPGDVFVYYELSNFYQNHRKYVKSLSFPQLRGEEQSADELDSLCSPLTHVTVQVDGVDQKQSLNPCGLVSNSLFSDVIHEPTVTRDGIAVDIQWTENGIAWDSDVESKFSQPDGFKTEECECSR
jgi:hypothetical protein